MWPRSRLLGCVLLSARPGTIRKMQGSSAAGQSMDKRLSTVRVISTSILFL